VRERGRKRDSWWERERDKGTGEKERKSNRR